MVLSESEKNRIKSMYGLVTEQNNLNNDLKKYIGKTILLYDDINQRETYFSAPLKIDEVIYDERHSRVYIKGKNTWTLVTHCKSNPSELDYEMTLHWKIKSPTRTVDKGGIVYNKQLIDSLKKDFKNNSITICKKPNADFGSIDKGDVSDLA